MAGRDGVIRFRLSGVSRPYDPAQQAIRPDLADVAEAATHFAPHYAEPVVMLARDAVPLRSMGSNDGDIVDTLAAGASMAVLDCTGGWAWGYRLSDHLVGYVPLAALAAKKDAATAAE